MSVSLFVGILPYWNRVNIGIFPVLDKISFWYFLDIPGIYLHSSSFALSANAELYIMVPLLTPWLIYSLTPYSLWRKVWNICQYRCYESDIWHGASLDTIIKIQEEPIRLTMWGPCLGNKRSKFWLFLLYLCFYLIEIFQIFTQILWENNRIVPCNVELPEPCWGHFGPCLA